MMDEKEYMILLRALVKEEVAAAMEEYKKPVDTVEEFISSKELCSALKISKQTLYNWLKHVNTKPLIEANRQKVGNKVGYNITGIKAAIKNNPLLFGNGRDYEFKMEVVMTAAQKADRRFKGISSKIFFSETVSGEDRAWYEAEQQQQEKEMAGRHDGYQLGNGTVKSN